MEGWKGCKVKGSNCYVLTSKLRASKVSIKRCLPAMNMDRFSLKDFEGRLLEVDRKAVLAGWIEGLRQERLKILEEMWRGIRKEEQMWSEVDEPKPTGNHEGFNRGGRVERGPLIVECWLHDEVSEGEIDDGTEEDARLDRKPRGRRPIHRQRREPWRDAAEYEGDKRREMHHSWGHRKLKVDFLHFNGGDPHEWLDKVEHYFQVYEVERANQVSTACVYLDGDANSWWRWIKTQYE
ncbi:hypothetical protein LWI28_023139 [Acer negundo]|uniref:Retrotransposon gag domain-containing protein n=1 Tax=Acer negundo TaxID=4023 RepID=A0AAD5JBF3_ACENE|nr:hypothetical protein LWI28_023139 [Acer negundo]